MIFGMTISRGKNEQKEGTTQPHLAALSLSNPPRDFLDLGERSFGWDVTASASKPNKKYQSPGLIPGTELPASSLRASELPRHNVASPDASGH